MTLSPTYDLFISYADADCAWVEGYLFDALNHAGVRYHSEEAFALGAPRLVEFERAVRVSHYVLLVLSPAYLTDNFAQFAELLAQSYGVEGGQWPVIPLILQPVTLPPRLSMLTCLDAMTPERWPDAVARLCGALQHPAPGSAPRPACPYPGMIPFIETDAGRFFGREREVDELLRRLRHQNYLFVIGPSGSGKSSLVYAGLIPELHRQQVDKWIVRIMRPGTKPVATLTEILGNGQRSATRHRSRRLRALSRDGQGSVDNFALVATMLTQIPTTRRLLLIIDQFEELFTQTPKADQAAFISLIKSLREATNCVLVLIMRADFYQDLMMSDLWPLDVSERLDVAPLRGAALREAIAKPAETCGVYLEAGLLERLQSDGAYEPGLLPLMQETMVLLWEKMERRLLPLSSYEQLGSDGRSGLAVAITSKANAVLATLSQEQRVIARRIFLRLIQFGEGRADTRRQQPVTVLRAARDNSSLFDQTLCHLVDNRLLTLSGEPSRAERRVDLAHELLISGWPTLQLWVQERREAEQTRRRLEIKAEEWVRLGRGGSGILDTVELQEAERWLASSSSVELGYSEVLIDLIRVSQETIAEIEREKEAVRQRELAQMQALAEAERQRAEEQERRVEAEQQRVEEQQRRIEEQGRSAKRLRRRLVAAVILAAIALMAAIFAAYNLFQTQLRNRIITARQLTAEARVAGDTFSQRSMLLGIEALKLIEGTNEQHQAAAEEALRESLASLGGRGLGIVHKESFPILSPDGHWLVTIEGKTIRLWDLTSSDPTANQMTLHGHTNDIIPVDDVISPDSRWLVTRDSESIRIWDLKASPVSNQSIALQNFNGYPYIAGISSDSRWLLTTSSNDPDLRLWNLTSTDRSTVLIPDQENHPISHAISRDGQWLVTISGTDVLHLWDLTTIDHNLPPITLSAGGLKNISYFLLSPDKRWLIVFNNSDDGMIRLWHLGVPSNLIDPHMLSIHSGTVRSMIVSPDSRWLVTEGFDDTTVNLWDLSTGDPSARPYILTGHEDKIDHMEISGDSRWLITTGENEAILRLWNLQAQDPSRQPVLLVGHADTVPVVVISPDNRWLLTMSLNDNRPRLWNLAASDPSAQPILLGDPNAPVYSNHSNPMGQFSHDSHWLAMANQRGKVQIFDMRAARPEEKPYSLSGHEDYLTYMTFSKDDRWLITYSSDGTGRILDVTSLDPASNPATRILLRSIDDSVFSKIDIDDSSRWLATITWKEAMLWDLKQSPQNKKPMVLIKDQQNLESVSISSDASTIAVANKDGTIHLWKRDGGLYSEMQTIHDNVENIEDVRIAISANNNWLVTMIYGRPESEINRRWFVKIWNLSVTKTNIDSKIKPAVQNETSSVVISSNKYWLVTVNGDTAILWDLTSDGLSHKSIVLPIKRFDNLAISSDARWLVTTALKRTEPSVVITDIIYDDKSINLWDLSSKSLSPILLLGHDESIEKTIFSLDSNWLVTIDKDNIIRRWSLESSNIATTSVSFHGHGDEIFDAVVTSDNENLLTSNTDGIIRQWPLKMNSLIDLACEAVGRNLSWDEWKRYFSDTTYHKTCANLPIHPSFVDAARDLAREGDVDAAIAQLQQAREIDPNLVIDPENEARQLGFFGLAEKGRSLAQAGRLDEAMATFQRAESINPARKIDALSWATLCRSGSLRGKAPTVMRACERAVELEPNNPYVHDSRGLARAMAGDSRGAIEDFEVYVAWAKQQSFGVDSAHLRETWITDLRQGKNPFGQPLADGLWQEDNGLWGIHQP